MDHIVVTTTNNLSCGSLGNTTSCCLICCSAYHCTEEKLNATAPNNTRHDRKRVTKATEKIFECLFVPKEYLLKVKNQPWMLSFCPRCMDVVDEIIELQIKIEILQLQIKWKVDKLGNIIINSPSDPLSCQKEVCKTFKTHVTQNFRHGLLPNLSVRLGKRVNEDNLTCKAAKSKTESETGQDGSSLRSINYSYNNYTDRSLHCNISEKVVADENVDAIKAEEEFINESNYASFGVTYPNVELDDRVFQHVDPYLEDASFEEVTVESKIFVGDTDFTEETNQIVTTEQNNTEVSPVGQIRFESVKIETSETELLQFKDGTDILKKLRPVSSGTRKKQRVNLPEEEESGSEAHYNSAEESQSSETDDSNFDPNSTQTGSKRQKRHMRTVRTGQEKELEELIKGRNYFKCTKCDYHVKRISSHKSERPSILRQRVADHYVCHHLPVKTTDVYKTETGNSCFRCTKCDYSVVVTYENKNFLRKLALHYIEVHDSIEIQSNSTLKNWSSDKPPEEALGAEHFSVERHNTQLSEQVDDIVFESLDATTNLHVVGLSNEEVIVQSTRIWFEDYEEAEEIDPSIIDKQERVLVEEKENSGLKIITAEQEQNVSEQLNKVISTTKPVSTISTTKKHVFSTPSTDPDELKRELEGLIEGRDYFKCTKCDYFAKKTSTVVSRDNCLSRLQQRVADHYIREHNPIKTLNKLKTIDGKYYYKCPECSFSVVLNSGTSSRSNCRRKLALHYMKVHDTAEWLQREPSQQVPTESEIGLSVISLRPVRPQKRVINTYAYGIRDPDELKRELEGLIEGRDYFKCTKCDYFSKKSPTNSSPYNIRRKVIQHYGSHHNPVKPSNRFKISNGKYCYRCRKCSFSIIFQFHYPTHPTAYKYYYDKLSLHYMEFHDAFENQSNSTSEGSLTSLTEGIDCFTCPVANCTFIAYIKREESKQLQLKNATEARLKIIQHYRTSPSPTHIEKRKDTLSEIIEASKAEGVSFYKCTKCDFKSTVGVCQKNITWSYLPRGAARRTLTHHFLLEHVLPWESFPGLHKYGCYEEKSETGNVLKCSYSDCDYCMEIQNELEEKNEEECKLAAYRCFFDNHGVHHNFNSIRTDDDSHDSEKPSEEPLSVENLLNEGYDRDSLQNTTDPQISMVYEEVNIESKPWLGDYEDEEVEWLWKK